MVFERNGKKDEMLSNHGSRLSLRWSIAYMSRMSSIPTMESGRNICCFMKGRWDGRLRRAKPAKVDG